VNTALLAGLSLAGIGTLGGLVYLLARFGARQAATAAANDVRSEMDREAVEAERKAGAVLGEHRDVGGTARRLSDGSF
jgi:hypothetical protein